MPYTFADMSGNGLERCSTTHWPSSFGDRLSYSPDWPWTHYIANDDFEILIFLPQSPECWDATMPISSGGDWTQGFLHGQPSPSRWSTQPTPYVAFKLLPHRWALSLQGEVRYGFRMLNTADPCLGGIFCSSWLLSQFMELREIKSKL